MNLLQPAMMEEDMKVLTWITLECIADSVLQDGLMTPGELRETLEALQAFARNPDTLIGGPRVFQAYGQAENRFGNRSGFRRC